MKNARFQSTETSALYKRNYTSARLNPDGEKRQKQPIETAEGFGSGKLL